MFRPPANRVFDWASDLAAPTAPTADELARAGSVPDFLAAGVSGTDVPVPVAALWEGDVPAAVPEFLASVAPVLAPRAWADAASPAQPEAWANADGAAALAAWEDEAFARPPSLSMHEVLAVPAFVTTGASVLDHPHRRRLHWQRRRRPGALPHPPAHCLSPIRRSVQAARRGGPAM